MQLIDKSNIEFRELEGRRSKIEELERDINKKYSNATEVERRLLWKEDSINSKERLLKMREGELDSKLRDLTEISIKLKKDQVDTNYFRDNFSNEKAELENERKNLAYMASYINQQKDMMEGEKGEMGNMRGALDMLRKDYLEKMKGTSYVKDLGDFNVKS